MGFIDFTNGEVLTADQMDLVMRQGIMRFADATARDTALSAVLAEGMMAYLDDTNEVLKYDGTDWIDISGDITGVTAGTALTGGGTSGDVTLNVDTAAVGSAIGIDTKQDDVITTQGDIVIGDASGDAVRLPVGAADTVLTSDGTTLSFAAASGGGAVAYQAPTNGGTFTVSIEAGTYGVLSDGAFPKQVGDIPLAEDTKVLTLDSEKTSLTFPSALLEFSKAGNIPNQSLRDITFGDGVYVACGFNDTLVRSTDGLNWTDVSFTTGRSLRTVAYGAGLFVLMEFAVDVYFTSPDGITWTQRTHPGGGSVRTKNLRFLNGNFVLCQDNGELRTSTDGLSWTLRTTGVAENLSNAFFGDGVYVAVGNAGRVITSTDSITWVDRGSIVARNLESGVYGNGIWVVVGDDISLKNNIFYSTDSGVTWTRATEKGSTLDFDIVIFDGTQFIAAGEQADEVEVSTDAIDWTVVNVDSPESILSGLFQDGRAFFVGDNGQILSSPAQQTLMLTSATVETLS